MTSPGPIYNTSNLSAIKCVDVLWFLNFGGISFVAKLALDDRPCLRFDQEDATWLSDDIVTEFHTN